MEKKEKIKINKQFWEWNRIIRILEIEDLILRNKYYLKHNLKTNMENNLKKIEEKINEFNKKYV